MIESANPSAQLKAVRLMQIRWRNIKVNPMPGAPTWVKFTARYPFLLLIPTSLMFYLACFFWKQITLLESGQLSSVYVGKLKLAYDLFGKWGVCSWFVFIGLGMLYLFWFYAISDSR
jgi:hypothetical protein